MENLYTLKKSLVSLQKRLDGIHIDSFNSSLLDDMLPIIYDFKELVFDSPILKETYINRVKVFKKYINTPEYNKDTDKISAFLIKHSDKNHFIPFILHNNKFIPHKYFNPIAISGKACNYETEEDFLESEMMFNDNTLSIYSKAALDEFYCYIIDDVCKKIANEQKSEETEQKLEEIEKKYIKIIQDKISGVNEYLISDVNLLEFMIYNPPQKMMVKMALNGCLKYFDNLIRTYIISLFAESKEETTKILKELEKNQKYREIYIDELSNEEKNVFNEAIQGYTAAEIAKKLSKSKRSVESQVLSIKFKLNLNKGLTDMHKIKLIDNRYFLGDI